MRLRVGIAAHVSGKASHPDDLMQGHVNARPRYEVHALRQESRQTSVRCTCKTLRLSDAKCGAPPASEPTGTVSSPRSKAYTPAAPLPRLPPALPSPRHGCLRCEVARAVGEPGQLRL
eukprot:5086467-Pleurochrysis_carterae.AAC.2